MAQLRAALQKSPLYATIYSLKPEAHKTARAFHAKDDHAEIRSKVFELLVTLDFKFYAAIKDMRTVRDYVQRRNRMDSSYRYHPNELYDLTVRMLFKQRLHKEDHYRVVFARRGKSDRTAALTYELVHALTRFLAEHRLASAATLEIIPAHPWEQPCIQVADYCMWALQRCYEMGEGRFLNALWPKVSVIHDVDDPQVGQKERKTQQRVVRLFTDKAHPFYLGYTYLGNWEEREGNRNIEPELLRAWLKKRGHDDVVIGKVLYELEKAAGDTSKTLYDRNKEVYSLRRYGVPVRPAAGQNKQTVQLFDWEHPERNDFAVAEEVTVVAVNARAHGKRTDVVLYVNGIALRVLELKRSTVSVAEGIRQNLDNQKRDFIQPFFSTIQFNKLGAPWRKRSARWRRYGEWEKRTRGKGGGREHRGSR